MQHPLEQNWFEIREQARTLFREQIHTETEDWEALKTEVDCSGTDFQAEINARAAHFGQKWKDIFDAIEKHIVEASIDMSTPRMKDLPESKSTADQPIQQWMTKLNNKKGPQAYLRVCEALGVTNASEIAESEIPRAISMCKLELASQR